MDRYPSGSLLVSLPMQVSDRRERGKLGLRTNEGEIDREESLRHGNIPKGNLTIHGLTARWITTKITTSALGDHPPDRKNVDHQVESMQTVCQTDTTKGDFR